MNKRIFTSGLIIFMILCGLQATETSKPNVLFIMVDDLRLQAGLYGQDNMKTPSIDKFGTEGVTFTRAYCSVPVCGASRASLLSGMRPTRDRFYDFSCRKDIDVPSVTSLPMCFKENGYSTISIGKVYHHNDDDIEAWTEKPYRKKAPNSVGRGYLADESKAIIAELNLKKGIGPAYESPDVLDSEYADGMVLDKAKADLKSLSKAGDPFFLAVGFVRPHLPFNAPKKYWDMYDEEDVNLAENPFKPTDAPDEIMTNWGELRQYYGIPKEGAVSDELARKLVHGYYASVSYTDALIGQLLDELDRLKLSKNTTVVLLGDHGWHLGEHGLWCKHANFDRLMNAPLIIKAAGKASGVKSETIVEFIDIYPTLCDLSGIEKPKHLDGKSLVSVLEDPSIAHKDFAFVRFHSGESIITKNNIYTEWVKDGQVTARMLTDLSTDPGENENVIAAYEGTQLLKDLKAHLSSFQTTTSKMIPYDNLAKLEKIYYNRAQYFSAEVAAKFALNPTEENMLLEAKYFQQLGQRKVNKNDSLSKEQKSIEKSKVNNAFNTKMKTLFSADRYKVYSSFYKKIKPEMMAINQ